MKNSLLLQIWSALPEAQQRQILKGVRSPLFNQREEVVLLFDIISQNTRVNTQKLSRNAKLSQDAFSKEAVFQQIYGSGNKRNGTGTSVFDDNKMRRLLTYALEVIRTCLAWDAWKNNTADQNLHVCRALKKAGLGHFFEKELQRAQAELEAAPERSDAYFFEKFSLEQEAWELFRQTQRSSMGDAQALNTSFAVFVAINSLRQGCTLLAQKTVVNVTATIPFLQETLRLAEEGMFQDIPAVSAWRASYLALTQPDNETHFAKLKRHIEQDSAVFPDSDLRDLYILAINVCIRRINIADKKYVREAFDLYRGGLACKVFLENGFLSKFTYRNILKSALGLGEWDWAFQYLQEFRELLPPKERDNIFQYNLATYYFRKNDYEQALELLRHVELYDMLDNFDARRMLLRMYFERAEWEALSYLLDSFNIYLQRHKEGGYHREMYRNLVRFTKKMIANPTRSKTQRQKMADEIRNTEFVAEREWLLSVL